MLASDTRSSTAGTALVEAAVESVADAVAAQAAGASRVELCARLDLGGTTPDLPLIEEVLTQVRIPVHVMVRPRGGDFTFTDEEIAQMMKDIAEIGSLRPAGIVTGAGSANGETPTGDVLRLVEAAGDMPMTFHRAFDFFVNPSAALEDLIDLRIARVLTAGGPLSAESGAERIGALVKQAGGRITVMAGGGVRAHNVRQIIRKTGVSEVHARFIDAEQMQSLVAKASGR